MLFFSTKIGSTGKQLRLFLYLFKIKKYKAAFIFTISLWLYFLLLRKFILIVNFWKTLTVFFIQKLY